MKMFSKCSLSIHKVNITVELKLKQINSYTELSFLGNEYCMYIQFKLWETFLEQSQLQEF